MDEELMNQTEINEAGAQAQQAVEVQNEAVQQAATQQAATQQTAMPQPGMTAPQPVPVIVVQQPDQQTAYYTGPVQGVSYVDPYIFRLQQSQQQVPVQKTKKPSFFKRFVLLALSAVLFGGLAGGAFAGIHWIEKRQNEKKNSASEKQEKEVSELDKKTGEKDKINYSVNNSTEVEKTAVTAVDVSAVAESAMPSIVAINNYMKQTYSYFFYDYTTDTESSGSGIIIGQNEDEVLIVTNYHVVDGAERLSVQFVDGTTADATIKGSASSSDLAVIAVKFDDLSEETVKAIRVARLGNSDNVRVGEMAIAVGNALGYGQSVTVGYISAKERTLTVDKVNYTLIQTDAAINPGNSGGALLNKDGEVIGINSVKYTSTKVEGMGFAIPISNVIDLIGDLSNREQLSEDEMAYLGIERGTDITDDYYAERFNIPKGLYVNSVAPNSAAEKAGITSGDIIVRIDKVIIYSMSDLQEFLSYTKAGTEVEIVIYRSNHGVYEEKVLKVKLEKCPSRPITEPLENKPRRG